MEQPGPVKPARGRNMWLIGGGCAALALLLVCCVAVGAVVYMSGGVDQALAVLGLASKAQAASLAPAQSPMFMAMDLDLQQAANFSKVWGIFQKSAQTKTGMDDLKKQFQDATGCDLETDIMPWWGPDAAVFFTDAANLSTSTSISTGRPASKSQAEPNVVVAIGARDKAKAQAAIAKCSKEKPTSEDTYKGYKVSAFENYSVALVGNYLLIASTSTAMHAAIDASAGGSTPNLAASANYKNVVAKLPTSRFATFYMDMSTLVSAYAESTPGIQPQMLDQLQAYQGTGASLAFTENGLRMDTIMLVNKDKLPECSRELMKQPPSANQGLRAVPMDTYLYVSGSNIKGIWDCSVTQLDATTKAQMDDGLKSIKQQMNIDLEADVLSWLTGEFAIALTPSKPLSAGMPGVGTLVLVEAKDQNLVKTKMDKLNVVFSIVGAQFKDQTVKGNKMKVATVGSGSSAMTMGYGFIDKFLVFGAPMDPLNSAIDASKNPLADDSTFKAVQAVLPAKNSGISFVNVTGLEKLVSSTLSASDRTKYQKDVQPWLKPIKGVGLAGDNTSTDTVSATLFIYVSGD